LWDKYWIIIVYNMYWHYNINVYISGTLYVKISSMPKEIIIKSESYKPSNLITKTVLADGWFTQELECSSNQHICVTDWTRKLILEVLGDKDNPENFKIYDIN